MVVIGKGIVNIVRWGGGCESERVMVLSLVFRVQAGADVTREVGTEHSALRSSLVRFFCPFRREPGLDRFYIFHNGTKNWTRPYRTGPLWLRAVTGPVLTSPELTSVLTSHPPVRTSYLLTTYLYIITIVKEKEKE